MPFHIGQRLSYSGELCTIKFIGEIPAWEGQEALGVEWDNPSKGKHSGCYKDFQYFEVSVPNSGSFLKSKKKHDGSVDFYNALLSTYADDFKASEIKIGSKVVESLGFEKLQRLQSDFHYLKDISLSRKCIDGFHMKNWGLVSDGLKNLSKLDLSFNLFDDFNIVMNILKALNVEHLNLAGNKFTLTTIEGVINSVKSIDLSLSHITDGLLAQLPRAFPNLTELHLSDNSYTSIPQSIRKFEKISTLNLSFNLLKEFPDVVSTLSNLTSLNLANNRLQIKGIPRASAHIQEINLRRNEITIWEEIDNLASAFPYLSNISVNYNPLFDKLTIEESESETIARVPTIMQLNGTAISAAERKNSELYFISKVNDGSVFCHNKDHFDNLLKKHNKQHTQIEHPRTGYNNTIGAIMLSLKFRYGNISRIILTLQDIEILKLKGMLSRCFRIDFNKLVLTYDIGSTTTTIDKNISFVSSLGLEDGQIITIKEG